MISSNDRVVEIIIPNELGYEQVAMAGSASFARLFGFPRHRIEDLKTVVGEASANAMQHGNRGRPDAKVKVLLQCENDAVIVQVLDQGEGINVFPSTPDIRKFIEENETITGFGLFLINQLADEVEFNNLSDQGHIVKMTINMKEQV